MHQQPYTVLVCFFLDTILHPRIGAQMLNLYIPVVLGSGHQFCILSETKAYEIFYLVE
jgi:hypothetical protein